MLVKTKKELKSRLASLPKNQGLGLVPTMGALHKGHMALVEKAVGENDAVVVTIFVNPTQFNNQEDLEKYPNTLEADLSLIKKTSENIIVFVPTIKEIYSAEIKAKTYSFDGLDRVMEGEFREGHFNGVGTIVEALLTLVMPDRAYFGEKDFQQLQIIRKLVALKQINVEIIGCPIVREASGLAMSSRNERLSKHMRAEASLIYRTLLEAKNKFGTKSAKQVVKWVQGQFQSHPDLELEYIAITDATNLRPIQRKQQKTKYRAFIAVYAEGVRLIDNIALN